MPWIGFDKGRGPFKKWPWRKVSWKVYKRLMREWNKRKPKPRKPRAITMYDSVTVSEIPKTAKAVAGYVGGKWPTYETLVKEFPKAHKLSIAIAATEDADCLDIEPGDAVPEQAADWVRRQHKRGVKAPVVYTSAAFAQQLFNLLDSSGLKHGKDFKFWTAHYTFKPHVCGPKCGFGIKFTADATQWTDKALGRNLDASKVPPGFFPIK